MTPITLANGPVPVLAAVPPAADLRGGTAFAAHLALAGEQDAGEASRESVAGVEDPAPAEEAEGMVAEAVAVCVSGALCPRGPAPVQDGLASGRGEEAGIATRAGAGWRIAPSAGAADALDPAAGGGAPAAKAAEAVPNGDAPSFKLPPQGMSGDGPAKAVALQRGSLLSAAEPDPARVETLSSAPEAQQTDPAALKAAMPAASVMTRRQAADGAAAPVDATAAAGLVVATSGSGDGTERRSDPSSSLPDAALPSAGTIRTDAAGMPAQVASGKAAGAVAEAGGPNQPAERQSEAAPAPQAGPADAYRTEARLTEQAPLAAAARYPAAEVAVRGGQADLPGRRQVGEGEFRWRAEAPARVIATAAGTTMRGIPATPRSGVPEPSSEAASGVLRGQEAPAGGRTDATAWIDPALPQDAASRPAPDAHAAGASRQVVQAVVVYRGAEARLVLDPEELGPVRLTVTLQDGGTLIQIVAERPETAEMMRRHADLLLQDLAESGVGPARLSFASGGETGSGRDGGGRAQPPAAGARPGAPSGDAPGPIAPDRAARPAGGLDMRV